MRSMSPADLDFSVANQQQYCQSKWIKLQERWEICYSPAASSDRIIVELQLGAILGMDICISKLSKNIFIVDQMTEIGK